MEWSFAILMNPEDEVGILTRDGKFAGICSQSEDYVRAHADRIYEAMVAVMKVEEHRTGLWVWKIRHGWTQVVGEKILTMGEGNDW